jgi:hypothetical protein
MLIRQHCLPGLQRAQQCVEFGRALQLAQVLSVRRRDIDGDVAGQGVGLVEANQVIIDRPLDRGIEVLADVDA